MFNSFVSLIQNLFSDPKFLWALYIVAQVIVMTIRPDLSSDFWKQVNAIVLALIASFTGGKVVTLRAMAKASALQK